MLNKVVIADHDHETFDLEKKLLEKVGADLVVAQCRSEEELISVAHDAVGIIYYFAPLTRNVIGNLKRCKIIVRRAIGTDNMELEAATRKKIYYCNVPDYCIEEVSDHALSMILCCQRRLVALHRSVIEGQWDYQAGGVITRMSGKTIGYLGFGRIGKCLSKKLQGLELFHIAYDPYASKATSGNVKFVDLPELLERSDFISLHLPLTDETESFLGEEEFKKMRHGSYIINTSRGGIIDEKALYTALSEGWIAGAALDVLKEEKPNVNNPLYKLRNVIITPHSGFYSREAMEELRRNAVLEIIRVLEGKRPKYLVNKEVLESQPTNHHCLGSGSTVRRADFSDRS